jgi:hypothetical protein
MAGIAVAESSKPKKGPKVLKRLEIEAQLGGGHIVTHHYTDWAHEPKPYKFNEQGKSQGGEHIMSHLVKHAGLPAMASGESTNESTESEQEE